MLDKLKSYLESIHITPISWLAGVSGVLMVRFFLESLSNPTSSGFFASDASTLIHYYLFFLTIAMVFMFLVQKALPDWRHIVSQLVVSSFLIIFIAPIIDWIVSAGKGLKMTYLFDSPGEMFSSFFLFLFGNFGNGVSLGLRIEGVLLAALLGLLVYMISRNWKRTLIISLVSYTVFFTFASLPGIISMIGQIGNLFQSSPLVFLQDSIAESSTASNNIHSSLQYSSYVRFIEISFNFIMGKILFLILVVLASFWFRLNFKEKFKAMIRNSRPERVAHYLLLIFMGVFLAFSIFPAIKFNWNDWLSVIVLCFSFYFSIMFAVCTNDVADEDTDKISNPDRPLVSNTLSELDMKQSAFMFLVASLISGFLAGYTAFFFVLTFTALYYIYSASPTRFKLIPFFSSFLIGFCCLTAVLAGFFLVSPLKYVSIFPVRLILAVVVLFFLGSHIRDLKDIDGDKAAGIKTVPVLFGDVWGPRIVGIFTSLAFLLVPVFLKIYLLFISAVPAAVVVYYFINRKPYQEKYIFQIYFTFIFASFLLLVF